MSVQRIASRYAKSLIELAQDQGKLEPVTDDIKNLRALLENRDLYLLLKSPVVNADKKKQIFKKLFEGKFDKLTTAFINILTTKARESYMPEIVSSYIEQYRRIKKISTVKVTSAVALDDQMLESIKSKLLESHATDNTIEFVTEVDPDLIGGFILEFEDRIYDTSLSNKLEGLKREFKENLYISQVIAK